MINLGAAIERVLTEYAKVRDFAVVPIEVEPIKEVVVGYSQVDSIVIEQVNLDTKHIWGQVRFLETVTGYGTDNRLDATIYIKKGMNDCWRRFVSCKEIMHCIIDDKDHDFVANMDALNSLGEGLVNSLLKALNGDGPCETEVMAEIMATEVLFPIELRESYVQRYRDGLLTDLQIATRFKIPEAIVRSAMAPLYMSAAQKMREKRLAIPAAA